MRIRRIAIHIRSNSTFLSCRTICTTVCFNTLLQLVNISLIHVESRASIVKLLQSIINFLLRCVRLYHQGFSILQSIVVSLSLLLDGVISRSIFLAISTQLMRVSSILVRWIFLRIRILINGFLQLISLCRKLFQLVSRVVHCSQNLCDISIKRLTICVCLNAIKIILGSRVTLCIRNLSERSAFRIFILIEGIAKRFMKLSNSIIICLLDLLSGFYLSFFSLSRIRLINKRLCILIRRAILNSQIIPECCRQLRRISCIRVNNLTSLFKSFFSFFAVFVSWLLSWISVSKLCLQLLGRMIGIVVLFECFLSSLSISTRTK